MTQPASESAQWSEADGAPATLGVGVGASACDIVLDLGEIHPSGHGALRLDCRIDTSADPARLVDAEVRPGLLHRGAEKLMESRDYRQALMLANRHDWLQAVTSEIAVALAVEELLGLQVPARATWLRTLLCEVNRASAALMHLAGAATLPPHGADPRNAPGMAGREALLRCLESLSGGRVHVMITRIGGLAHDATDAWLHEVRESVGVVRAQLPELRDALERAVPRGVAPLPPAIAIEYGVTGPVLRACGVPLDLRRNRPYLAYADLLDEVRVITAPEGDALARYRVLLEQLEADLDLIEVIAGRIPPGPISVSLPKVVRAPEGAAYSMVESCTGIAGAYVVSVGEATPSRVRLRTPSYAHAQAMALALPGTALPDLAAAVSSFLLVAGDVDH